MDNVGTIVIVAPLAEQRRIVSKVDELMEHLNQLEKTILAEEIILLLISRTRPSILTLIFIHSKNILLKFVFVNPIIVIWISMI